MSERTRKLSDEGVRAVRVSAEGALTDEQIDELLDDVSSTIPSAVVWTRPGRVGITADDGDGHKEQLSESLRTRGLILH